MTEPQPGDIVKVIGNLAGLYHKMVGIVKQVNDDKGTPYRVTVDFPLALNDHRIDQPEWGLFNPTELERIDT